MNTRKGKKKRKVKKRKFGTKSMTLDRYKVQVKDTIEKYVYKNKKVKNYYLRVRLCFKVQHLKGKNLANFLRYYKEQKIYNKQLEIVVDEYITKRHEIYNIQYKRLKELYSNLQYTTYENRLDFLSITQHPILTKEEKNFILKEINKTENYDENMYGHFKRIVERLYPVPEVFRNLTFNQIRGILINGYTEHLLNVLTPEQYGELSIDIESFRNNTPVILWNKKRLGEIMDDVYKKDITEEYVRRRLTPSKKMEKNGLFIDSDGILNMRKNSPIINEIRRDFRRKLLKEEYNKFSKLGRLKDFSYVDLSGIKLNEGIFSNCNFRNAILKEASLEFCALEGANLEGANLEGANLTQADLGRANLKGARLTGTKIQKANLEGADLKGADLKGADLKEAEMQKSNFENAILKEASLEFCTLEGANLEGADLEGANLKGAELQGANLRGASLYKVTGENAHIFDTNLEGADLREAYLGEAELQRSNLKGANLKGANLEDVDLQEANLKGANLEGANLQGTDFRGTEYDDATRFPEGFNPGERGMVRVNHFGKKKKKSKK